MILVNQRSFLMPSEPSEPSDPRRRTLLQTAIGLAVTASALESTPAIAAPTPAPPPGKPGEFDFLSGSWKISHRKLKKEGTQDWDEFPGEATCWSILGGVASIEELRIPARKFSGMGLRLLDVEKHVWSDFWVNSQSGVITTPGLPGGFKDGVGIFEADDVDGEKPIKVRGVWDRITPTSCRWYQAISRDDGKTWVETWLMDWVRA